MDFPFGQAPFVAVYNLAAEKLEALEKSIEEHMKVPDFPPVEIYFCSHDGSIQSYSSMKEMRLERSAIESVDKSESSRVNSENFDALNSSLLSSSESLDTTVMPNESVSPDSVLRMEESYNGNEYVEELSHLRQLSTSSLLDDATVGSYNNPYEQDSINLPGEYDGMDVMEAMERELETLIFNNTSAEEVGAKASLQNFSNFLKSSEKFVDFVDDTSYRMSTETEFAKSISEEGNKIVLDQEKELVSFSHEITAPVSQVVSESASVVGEISTSKADNTTFEAVVNEVFVSDKHLEKPQPVTPSFPLEDLKLYLKELMDSYIQSHSLHSGTVVASAIEPIQPSSSDLKVTQVVSDQSNSDHAIDTPLIVLPTLSAPEVADLRGKTYFSGNLGNSGIPITFAHAPLPPRSASVGSIPKPEIVSKSLHVHNGNIRRILNGRYFDAVDFKEFSSRIELNKQAFLNGVKATAIDEVSVREEAPHRLISDDKKNGTGQAERVKFKEEEEKVNIRELNNGDKSSISDDESDVSIRKKKDLPKDEVQLDSPDTSLAKEYASVYAEGFLRAKKAVKNVPTSNLPDLLEKVKNSNINFPIQDAVGVSVSRAISPRKESQVQYSESKFPEVAPVSNISHLNQSNISEVSESLSVLYGHVHEASPVSTPNTSFIQSPGRQPPPLLGSRDVDMVPFATFSSNGVTAHIMTSPAGKNIMKPRTPANAFLEVDKNVKNHFPFHSPNVDRIPLLHASKPLAISDPLSQLQQYLSSDRSVNPAVPIVSPSEATKINSTLEVPLKSFPKPSPVSPIAENARKLADSIEEKIKTFQDQVNHPPSPIHFQTLSKSESEPVLFSVSKAVESKNLEYSPDISTSRSIVFPPPSPFSTMTGTRSYSDDRTPLSTKFSAAQQSFERTSFSPLLGGINSLGRYSDLNSNQPSVFVNVNEEDKDAPFTPLEARYTSLSNIRESASAPISPSILFPLRASRSPATAVAPTRAPSPLITRTGVDSVLPSVVRTSPTVSTVDLLGSPLRSPIKSEAARSRLRNSVVFPRSPTVKDDFVENLAFTSSFSPRTSNSLRDALPTSSRVISLSPPNNSNISTLTPNSRRDILADRSTNLSRTQNLDVIRKPPRVPVELASDALTSRHFSDKYFIPSMNFINASSSVSGNSLSSDIF